MLMPLELKMTTESMRYSIVKALMVREEEIAAQVATALDETLDAFDFQSVVKKEIDSVLAQAIQRAVKRAVDSAMYDDNVDGALKEAVAKSIAPWAEGRSHDV